VSRRCGLIAVLCLAIGVAGCGRKQDRRICQDVPKAEQAIENLPIRGDFKRELLDDISERAAEANCPGYDDEDDS
jgi:hypothetical protein